MSSIYLLQYTTQNEVSLDGFIIHREKLSKTNTIFTVIKNCFKIFESLKLIFLEIAMNWHVRIVNCHVAKKKKYPQL